MERSAYWLLRARVSTIPCPASQPNGDSADTTDLSQMQTAIRQTPPICLTCKRRVVMQPPPICFTCKRRVFRHHRFVSYANGESSDTTDLSPMQTASRHAATTNLFHMQAASLQTPPICLICKRRVVRHHRFVSYANGESSDTTDLSHVQTASPQTPPICLMYKRRVLRHHRFVCYASQEACQSGLAVARHRRETVHRLCFSFFQKEARQRLTLC